jgi:hypothetical protein
MNDLHILHGLADAACIANVTVSELNLLWPCRVFPNIENLDPLAPLQQAPSDQVAQETGTACDQVSHSESIQCSVCSIQFQFNINDIVLAR